MPDAPAPFNLWFPATNLTETLFEIVDKSVKFGPGNFSVPVEYAETDIQLTMYDTNTCVLEEFFTKWRNQMFPGPCCVATLCQIVKKFYLAKLDNQRLIKKQVGFWVRPSGKFFFQGTAEPTPRTYMVNLKICGYIGTPDE